MQQVAFTSTDAACSDKKGHKSLWLVPKQIVTRGVSGNPDSA